MELWLTLKKLKKKRSPMLLDKIKICLMKWRRFWRKLLGLKLLQTASFCLFLLWEKSLWSWRGILKSNARVKYLNFDYFKRKNKEINETWLKNRKDLLERKIKKFEEMLDKNTVLIKNRIDDELAKLHYRRQKQLNMLTIKFNKC